MKDNSISNFLDIFNLFDMAFIFILIYCIIQCVIKGFTLSFISFMKWIVALIITIILTPKFQPWVSEYVNSPFINDLGLGIAIYVATLFTLILLGKAFKSSMKWTGFGTMDKTFGFFFGVFQGYVVSVCIFSILNWFYPFNKWDIEVSKALSYEIINNGSNLLIEEFPKYRDFEKSKEKIEKL